MSALSSQTLPPIKFRHRLAFRKGFGRVAAVLLLLCVFSGLFALLTLLVQIIAKGAGHLDWQFLNSFPSRFPEQAGIKSALLGTFWVMALVIIISFPLGIATAFYLHEYASDTWFKKVIQTNISNLAGVPSIIYGLLGLAVFVRWFSLGSSVIAGALTLVLVILPVIIIASYEALVSVPPSLHHASYALGASRWQTIWHVALPYAMPGMLTGSILAFARAIGETAPLITIGALTFIAFTPSNLMDPFTVLPIQVFNWTSRPQEGFHEIAATAIIVLLLVLLAMNALALIIRYKFQRRAGE